MKRKFPAVVGSVAVALALAALLLCARPARAEVKPVVDRNDNDQATAAFKFKRVPAPSKSDAASKAKVTIVAGERDGNGAEVDALTDGRLPTEGDEPRSNFFFNAGSEGGRLLLDLGTGIDVKQVNTYSWHADTRGPQVYTLYAGDGFLDAAKAAKEKDPEKHGWHKVAAVDTRPKQGDPGGQYGVSLAEADGTLGKYRWLLFDVRRTENDDPFGNTFYSEIDVIDASAPAAPAGAAAPAPAGATTRAAAGDGKYEITIDTTNAPDLTEWANETLLPVCVKWYPIIVEMLPSEGFDAPKKFSISFRDDMTVPAATGGTRIMCSTKWMKQNVKGEAAGAVVHEMVHVVQQYPGFLRRNRAAGAGGASAVAAPATAPAARNPGWLTEGIPDYIRWFKYEPQTHGADIRNPARAKYDASYRVSANFLNFVSDHYDKDLVKKLNAAMRQGKYSEGLWKEYTGKTAPELGEEWKESLEKGK